MTKDTRSKSKRNKLCWAVCLGAVALAIILAILALAGVFSKVEPTPVEESRNFPDTAKAGFGIGGSNDTVNRIEAGSPEPEPSSTTTTTTTTISPDEEDEDSDEDPFGGENNINYVENSLEGQITLMDATFDPQYSEKNSEAYKNLVSDLEGEIKKILDKDGNQHYNVKILDLK